MRGSTRPCARHQPEWHPELTAALVSIPEVMPGDTVFWHTDICRRRRAQAAKRQRYLHRISARLPEESRIPSKTAGRVSAGALALTCGHGLQIDFKGVQLRGSTDHGAPKWVFERRAWMIWRCPARPAPLLARTSIARGIPMKLSSVFALVSLVAVSATAPLAGQRRHPRPQAQAARPAPIKSPKSTRIAVTFRLWRRQPSHAER